MANLKKNSNTDEIIDAMKQNPRIKLVNSNKGFGSTAKIIEYARDLLRPRYDMYEVCVWEDSLNVVDKRIYFIQAVHQESIVVPENIDAIRAMFKLENKHESIQKTNKSLGIK